MSAGTRHSLPAALSAATHLMGWWKMRTPSCAIVGSIRRRRPDVGDIELLAPLPHEGERDLLYEAIRDSFEPAGMFDDPGKPHLTGRVVKGLKAGFKECDLICNMTRTDTGEVYSFPTQVFRYESGDRGNRGWIELMRTGPGDFGKWFLGRWKKHHGISPLQQASIDGHLVDSYGKRIPTRDEDDAFRHCGMKPIPPEKRDSYVMDSREMAEVFR